MKVRLTWGLQGCALVAIALLALFGFAGRGDTAEVAGGITGTGNQLWHQDNGAILDIAEPFDGFGDALATGDFNGDGKWDLAVGIPYEDIDGTQSAGAVSVLYGSGGGLNAAGDQFWHQGSPGIQGAVEEGDSFGSSLASGDFNRDGFDDLAVGVAFEDIGAISNAGAVNILYGSGDGLTEAGDQIWDQDSPEILGVPEASDHFGMSLASGDFDHDGFRDLAVGVGAEDVGGAADAGAVNILYGSGDGLAAARNQIWGQNSPGILGGAEENDFFGGALASGDFNHDGFDDLAAGVAGEDIGDIVNAGAVAVLFGSGDGLTDAGDQLWDQNSPGIQGGAEGGDLFGSALAAGFFDGDQFEDLAVGVPEEGIDGVVGAGAVAVLYGSGSGLTDAGDQLWHQNSTGVPGGNEMGDGFGTALTGGNFDGDAFDDLAVGMPDEEINGVNGAGAVNVIYGSGGGLTGTGAQMWHQGSTGVLGSLETDDAFGSALASGDFDDDGADDLAIGVPQESVNGDVNAGAVNVLYGSAPETPTETPLPTATPGEGAPTPTLPSMVLPGDVNCDGTVNSVDAALVLQFSAGLVGPLPCHGYADVSKDGDVNSIDAALILQYTAGLIPTLPP